MQIVADFRSVMSRLSLPQWRITTMLAAVGELPQETVNQKERALSRYTEGRRLTLD
jgi:hypothetical protein